MHLSAPFIRHRVATTLLSFALLLTGAVAYVLLPVASLPQVEYPTISVQCNFPGTNAETMASAIAAPLERQFGHIAGITEMTSASQQGIVAITLQFDLDRDLNGAARDVQAAINAARNQLPADLPANPTYRKVNPAEPYILQIALTSDTATIAQMYDAADTILAQRIAQVPGVGQVQVVGSTKPAVRIEVNPTALTAYGIGVETLRSALSRLNVNQPKGGLSSNGTTWTISATDQLFTAKDYRSQIIAYRDGAPVRISDVATVRDSVEDIYTGGIVNGVPSILIHTYKTPGANVIETVDEIKDLMPAMRASISPAINMKVTLDRTVTIRASVKEITRSLLISIVLVILVVFLFLREGRATIIPSVSVPLSLAGTFAVMYLLHYTLDNLSLMALTISTGFVVDDAIVVIENISRHMEEGMSPLAATMVGSREVGFTVLSMSLSLIAVFIPILLMKGIVGRLFQEFAIVLSVAILVSLGVSLTTTPMLSATFLAHRDPRERGRFYRAGEHVLNFLVREYEILLDWVLDHQTVMLEITVLTAALSVYLYIIVPKGFFPQQDIGRIAGSIRGPQDISFDAMQRHQHQFQAIVQKDPAIAATTSFLGSALTNGGSYNQSSLFMTLKSMEDRHGETADKIIARLRPKLSGIPGATAVLSAQQDLTIGGRSAQTQFQYTLTSNSVADLMAWAPRVMAGMRKLPELQDIATDQQDRGLEDHLVIDRTTASRLGITVQNIDDTLFDSFGQRDVSTMYMPQNQYHVVLAMQKKYQEDPGALDGIYVRNDQGKQVPLSAFSHYEPRHDMLIVNHQGQFPAVTLSFNLSQGVALSQASDAVAEMVRNMRLPATVHGQFAGTAQAFQSSLKDEPILILFALCAVYVVLGVLYESFIHPLTILSTLPSAGVGAILALMLTKMDLNVIAMIGILLLIGIVKKNAIMMIDFALDAERNGGKSPREAIFQACLLRFRPILMTTAAALLGALPLALGAGTGSELRRPLGITIAGGLIVSQALTLFTTPVVYLFFDKLQRRISLPHPLPDLDKGASKANAPA
ncbi:MAG TPA: efflux RND transporter permease subunit [Acidobacteriaceae bacterium]|nr:efflux RND transporter permease subunit [Acidobacteriaceae bacterium]